MKTEGSNDELLVEHNENERKNWVGSEGASRERRRGVVVDVDRL